MTEPTKPKEESSWGLLAFTVLLLCAYTYMVPEKMAWIGGMVVLGIVVIWITSNQQKAKAIFITILQVMVGYVVIIGIALLLGLFIKR